MKKNYKLHRVFPLFVLMFLAVVGFSQEVVNTAFGPETGEFTVEMDVVPSHSPMNGGVGLSDVSVGAWSDMACIVGFHTMGFFTAYNSSGYEMENEIPFSAGVSYHIVMDVDVPNKTYSVTITPDGEESVVLATDYGFRTGATELNTYASYNDANTAWDGIPGATMDITNFSNSNANSYASTKIYSVTTAPVIDGDLSDWDAMESHPLVFDENGAGSAPEDFSGYWKAAWKDSVFYVMAVITDDTLYNGGAASWNKDAVNFYLGLDNDRNGLGASNGTNKYLYNHWWGHDADALGVIDGLPDGQVSKIDLADGSGWAIEWSAPFSQMDIDTSGQSFGEGTKFIFDVVAVDIDDELDSYIVRGWSPGSGAASWTSMDNAGEIELAVPEAVYSKTQIESVDVTPVIDGDISDWDAMESHPLSFDENGAGSAPEDFSGYWKATWKDSVFYVMAVIKDDTLYNGGAASWNKDAVNFYIGLDNVRNGLGASNGDSKYLFHHWWGHDDNALGVIDGLPDGHVSKFDLADGSGWGIEWSAPFSQMDIDTSGQLFVEGTKFIFDVVAVDIDDELDSYIVRGWSDQSGAASWSNMDNAGEIELTVPAFVPSNALIHNVSTAPVIDGDLSDWDAIPANDLSFDENGANSSPEDFSGYWKSVWKDSMFYVMAVIKDDTLYNGGAASWNKDAVNFYIGLDNDRNGLGASNGTNKYLYHHWWGHADDELGVISSLPNGQVSKIDLADGTGWAIEWSAPFSQMDLDTSGQVFEEGTKFIFDVVAVDLDEELDSYIVRGWADGSGAASWSNMDKAGEVELGGALPIVHATTIIKGANTAPVIDGDLSDWDAMESHDLSFDENGAGSTPEDFSGYWKATWKDSTFYVMAVITDDALYNGGAASWNKDAVNFYIGLDNDRNGLGASNGANKYLYHHWWGHADDELGVISGLPNGQVSKIDLADGTGWAIEWSAPFSQMDIDVSGQVFEVGTKFIFDVVAVDLDDELDTYIVRGWSDGSGAASWSNMDNAGEIELGLADPEPVFAKTQIKGAPTAPVINGDYSEWEDIEAHDLAYDEHGANSSAEDFSGYWKAAWDFDNLYMMVEINDDTLYNGGAASWNKDAMNFYIGIDNDRNGLGASNDTHKYLFNHWWGFADDEMGGTADLTGVEVAKINKDDGTGWMLEWKIPFDQLDINGVGFVPEDGAKFIFDVVAVDLDDELDSYIVRGWSDLSGAASWSNMDNAGEIELTEPVATEKAIAPTFKLHPNPVTNDLMITNFDGVHFITLYNMTGQKVRTVELNGGETQATLNMHNLANGFYLISLTSDEGTATRKILKQ